METPYDRSLGRLRVAATWAAVLALLAWARPSPMSLAVGAPLVAAGAGLRAWAAGHLRKTVELTTAGPYRYTRNPLYLGRLAIFSGLCLAARLPHGLQWGVLLAGWALFFGYYLPRKERVEPARLLEVHGERYARYRRAVPALVPAWRPYREGSGEGWSATRARANREHWMLVGVALALAWLVVRTR